MGARDSLQSLHAGSGRFGAVVGVGGPLWGNDCTEPRRGGASPGHNFNGPAWSGPVQVGCPGQDALPPMRVRRLDLPDGPAHVCSPTPLPFPRLVAPKRCRACGRPVAIACNPPPAPGGAVQRFLACSGSVAAACNPLLTHLQLAAGEPRANAHPLPAACTPCGYGSLLPRISPSRGESDSRGLRQGPALYTLDAAMAAVWLSSPKQYHCSSTLELAPTLGVMLTP